MIERRQDQHRPPVAGDDRRDGRGGQRRDLVPGRGQLRYRGTSYGVVSFAGRAFPSGPLRISLLIGAATAPPR